MTTQPTPTTPASTPRTQFQEPDELVAHMINAYHKASGDPANIIGMRAALAVVELELKQWYWVNEQAQAQLAAAIKERDEARHLNKAADGAIQSLGLQLAVLRSQLDREKQRADQEEQAAAQYAKTIFELRSQLRTAEEESAARLTAIRGMYSLIPNEFKLGDELKSMRALVDAATPSPAVTPESIAAIRADLQKQIAIDCGNAPAKPLSGGESELHASLVKAKEIAYAMVNAAGLQGGGMHFPWVINMAQEILALPIPLRCEGTEGEWAELLGQIADLLNGTANLYLEATEHGCECGGGEGCTHCNIWSRADSRLHEAEQLIERAIARHTTPLSLKAHAEELADALQGFLGDGQIEKEISEARDALARYRALSAAPLPGLSAVVDGGREALRGAVTRLVDFKLGYFGDTPGGREKIWYSRYHRREDLIEEIINGLSTAASTDGRQGEKGV